MAALTLVSHNLCPYVQRAAIALAEKRVAFAKVYVDLSDKPDWFRAISPLGKVPLLRVASGGGEQVIFESAVILEYLEETQANPLHPDHPLDRARHRSWIEFGSALLNGIARMPEPKRTSRGSAIACATASSASRWSFQFGRVGRSSNVTGSHSSMQSSAPSSGISMCSRFGRASASSMACQGSGHGGFRWPNAPACAAPLTRTIRSCWPRFLGTGRPT